jgi:hypothetical protein
MSVFVIRHVSFAYNDEWFTNDGDLGGIKAVFDDEASAQTELQRLTVAFWRGEELSSYGTFCEPEAELIDKLNAFCLAHCGQPLTDENGYDYQLPSGLSDADIVEFVKIADLMPYQVVEIPDGGGFVALWLPEEERYLSGYETDIIYHPNVEAFMTDVPYQLYDAFPTTWQGSYISHSPVLLRQLVASQPDCFQYNDTQQQLSLKKKIWEIPGAQLFALNALLKTPVFEVRQLSVDELVAMDA